LTSATVLLIFPDSSRNLIFDLATVQQDRWSFWFCHESW